MSDTKKPNTNIHYNGEISQWLTENRIIHCLDPEDFISKLNEDEKKKLFECQNVCDLAEGLDYSPNTFPFAYLYLKPHPAKRSTRYFIILDSERNMNSFSLSTGRTESLGKIESLTTKPKRQLFFQFEGEAKPREFSVKQPIIEIDKIIEFIFMRNENVMNPAHAMFQSFAELPEEAPKEVPPELFKCFQDCITAMLTATNMKVLETFQCMALPPSFLREIGTLTALLLVKKNTYMYVIYVLLSIYMKSIDSTNLLMRQENFVIRIMNEIRNIFCKDYLEGLYYKITEAVENMNESEQYLRATLNVMKENPPPPVLRVLLATIAKAAKRRFPNEECAALNAMSGFFLLRGLGPKLKPKDIQLRIKFSILTLLFNFTNNSNVLPFIPELKAYLTDIAENPKPEELQELKVSEVDIKEAVKNVINELMKHCAYLAEKSAEVPKIKKDGITIFLENAINIIKHKDSVDEYEEM